MVLMMRAKSKFTLTHFSFLLHFITQNPPSSPSAQRLSQRFDHRLGSATQPRSTRSYGAEVALAAAGDWHTRQKRTQGY